MNPCSVKVHNALDLLHAFTLKHFETMIGTGLIVDSRSKPLHRHYFVRIPLEQYLADILQAFLVLVSIVWIVVDKV